MKARLSDNIYLTELTNSEYSSIKKALTFRNPKYLEAVKFNRSTYDIPRELKLFDLMCDGLIIPRGFNLKLLLNVVIKDDTICRNVSIETTIKPRTYQERVLRLAISHGGGVIVAPTGSGKTTMGIELASRLGERCLILVKSVDLAKQWQGAIKQFTGLECGLIGGGKYNEGEAFTVGLVQSLVKIKHSLNYGLVIVDECHNVPAAQAYDVINRQSAKYRYGLSATPERRDGLEFMIYSALGDIVAKVEAHEVGGAVLPVTVITRHYNFMGNPESWTQFINQIGDDEDRNTMLIGSAIKSSRAVGTAVLTGTIKHAEALHTMAIEYGVNGLLLHGQLPNKQRNQGMLDAPKHSLIIGTLSLLSEGIDWPHIGAIIFAAPVSAEIDRDTPTATRLIQSIGRGRRPFKGKTKTVVLDIIDNHPLGKSAYYKRSKIYEQQGFKIEPMN
jgi:superfamily II DNA or RNA helicase